MGKITKCQYKIEENLRKPGLQKEKCGLGLWKTTCLYVFPKWSRQAASSDQCYDHCALVSRLFILPHYYIVTQGSSRQKQNIVWEACRPGSFQHFFFFLQWPYNLIKGILQSVYKTDSSPKWEILVQIFFILVHSPSI